MKQLRIAQDLALPVEAVTQTFLVVGKRGSGKSNTAARIVEQLLAAKVPVVVLDPVDTWWGLKASRDGRGQGHSVYVFGGRHKDVDLEAGAGALVAEFLCEHRAPLVLSCKHLSGLERSRFMVDFALTLFRKWTGGVLHLVLEEAHELAPQAPPKGEKAEEMLGAFKRLWKLGRSSGIGGTAITQRPASLHKDITTQSEILVVHRTIGPQDVAAVREWIKYHQRGEQILPALATLKTGEAFVWAPEFPEGEPIGLRRVQVLPRETFDSSSTPRPGEERAEPKALAAVDLDRLRSRMAATMDRAKAEDPRELRKTIAELRQRLASAERAKPVAPRVVEKAVLKDAQIGRLEAQTDRVVRAVVALQSAAHDLDQRANEIKAALAAARDTQRGAAGRILAADGRSRAAVPHLSPGRGIAALIPDHPVRRAQTGDGGLLPARQRILDALAWLESVGIPQANRTQLALLADASPTSSAYANNLGALRSACLIDYGTGSTVMLSPTGRATARAVEAPPTAEDLQASILRRLEPAKARILQALIRVYPEGLKRDALADLASASATSSAYANNLGALRSLGVIDYRGGEVFALPVLFLEDR